MRWTRQHLADPGPPHPPVPPRRRTPCPRLRPIVPDGAATPVLSRLTAHGDARACSAAGPRQPWERATGRSGPGGDLLDAAVLAASDRHVVAQSAGRPQARAAGGQVLTVSRAVAGERVVQPPGQLVQLCGPAANGQPAAGAADALAGRTDRPQRAEQCARRAGSGPRTGTPPTPSTAQAGSAAGFLARLGWTRIGSPGIFGERAGGALFTAVRPQVADEREWGSCRASSSSSDSRQQARDTGWSTSSPVDPSFETHVLTVSSRGHDRVSRSSRYCWMISSKERSAVSPSRSARAVTK